MPSAGDPVLNSLTIGQREPFAGDFLTQKQRMVAELWKSITISIMNSRFLIPLICLAAVVAGFCYRQGELPGEGAGKGGRAGGIAAVADRYSESDFRREFPAELQSAREQAGLKAMTVDPRLDQWLSSNARRISSTNLDRTVAEVDIPGFKSIRATGVSGGSLRGLSEMLRNSLTTAASDMDNRMGYLLRTPPEGGHEIIVLTGEALPELTLASLNAGTSDAFVDQCPHCRKRMSLLCEKSGCGMAVDCPDCGRRCRVLAQDTNGQYRDATTFLLRSPCPEVAPGTDPLDAMLSLWQSAVRRISYVEDHDPAGAVVDHWQTPGQTLRRGAGDCEDSALLLTDWLLTRSISARMAMGKMDGGGHAWCIARVGGTDYLLEATNRNPDMNNLPVVKRGDGYEPVTLIDREALYVRAHPTEPFDGDYWSPKKWIRLPRTKPAAAKTAARPAGAAAQSGHPATARN